MSIIILNNKDKNINDQIGMVMGDNFVCVLDLPEDVENRLTQFGEYMQSINNVNTIESTLIRIDSDNKLECMVRFSDLNINSNELFYEYQLLLTEIYYIISVLKGITIKMYSNRFITFTFN